MTSHHAWFAVETCVLSSELFVFRLCQGMNRAFEVLSQIRPLTQGNGLNPNHDGSSTERDVPNEFCVLRNKSLSRERKQPTFFLFVYACKHGQRRSGEVRR